MTVFYLTFWLTSIMVVGTEDNPRLRRWWWLVPVFIAGVWFLDSSGVAQVFAAAVWLVSFGAFVGDMRKAV